MTGLFYHNMPYEIHLSKKHFSPQGKGNLAGYGEATPIFNSPCPVTNRVHTFIQVLF